MTTENEEAQEYSDCDSEIQHRVDIPPTAINQRLDQVLAAALPDYSRSRLQNWIKQGRVLLDGEVCKPRQKLYGGEEVLLRVPFEPASADQPEAMDLNIVYEDESLLIINKPAGLVVHPAAGHARGTLVNGLLHHDPELSQLPRAGIVHRLDKDTTGLMVVARTLQAHHWLVAELQERHIKREYVAICEGIITAGRTIDAPIARHPQDRLRMAVRDHGRPSVTHFRVTEKYRHHCLLDVQLETGRTHQIRVHMAWLRHPLVGDAVYGGRLKLPAGASETLQNTLRRFRRQALHAKRLSLTHPKTQQWLEFESALPLDLQQLCSALQEDKETHVGST